MLWIALCLCATSALACSTLPNGQSKTKYNLVLEDLTNIPLQFVYCTTAVTGVDCATSMETAKKNFRQYIKKAFAKTMQEEAAKVGINADVTTLKQQLTPKIKSTLLTCKSAGDTSCTGGTASMPCCNATDNKVVDKINDGAEKDPPQDKQKISFDLQYTNARLAQLNDNEWDSLLYKVQKKINNGIDGEYDFGSVKPSLSSS